jgi:hypothetical protein
MQRARQPAPETEEDMYVEIMKYIDRMFNIVRPRRVLYMAIGTLHGHRRRVAGGPLTRKRAGNSQTAWRRAPR